MPANDLTNLKPRLWVVAAAYGEGDQMRLFTGPCVAAAEVIAAGIMCSEFVRQGAAGSLAMISLQEIPEAWARMVYEHLIAGKPPGEVVPLRIVESASPKPETPLGGGIFQSQIDHEPEPAA